MKKKPLPINMFKGVPYQALKSLGPSIMLGIGERLIDGQSGAKVAAWLQNDLKVLTELRPDSLKKTLERYRKKELREKTIKKIAEAQKGLTLATVVEHYNALTEMEEITKLQRARVQKMIDLEADKPMLLKTTTDELRLMKELLVSLGSMQLETGVMGRATKTITGTVTDGMGLVKAFSWQEAEERLYTELVSVKD